MRLWELMGATLGFLYHPNIWIRQSTSFQLGGHPSLQLSSLPGAAAFLASASKHLPSSDVWCILYPSLRHLLRSEIREIDEVTLLTTMKSPVRTAPNVRQRLYSNKSSVDAEAYL